MAGARWIKWKKNRGPDIWEYKSGVHVCNPGIDFLKRKDKVIAKFFGPIDLNDGIIINHIKTVYHTENRLKLSRLVPSPQKDVVIKHRSSKIILHFKNIKY